MSNFNYYWIFAAILFIACERQTDWQLDTSTGSQLVVQSIITNEYKPQQIILTSTVSSSTAEPELISGASVKVIVNKDYPFHELSPGVYVSDTIAGVIGKEYQLVVDWNSRQVTATCTMLPVYSFLRMAWGQAAEKENMYRINWVCEEYNSDEYALYEITLDRPVQAEYIPDTGKAVLYYYTLPFLDVSQILNTNQYENIYFPSGTKVTEKKYSLTYEHAAYIRSLLLETTWRGGIFDVQRGNVETNIDGGLGYFFASSVAVDTFSIP